MSVFRVGSIFKRQILKTCTLSTASYASHPLKFLEVQQKWKTHDNVPKQYDLIYKAPMENGLNYLTTYLTLSSSFMSVVGIYYGLSYNNEDADKPFMLGEDVVLADSPAEALIYVGAFIGLNVAVKMLLTKYVIRLYQDGDDYIAVFRSHMFNSIVKHSFKLNEFKRLNPPMVVSWGDARFALGNKHAILLENYFKTPEYFNYLLTKKVTQGRTDLE